MIIDQHNRIHDYLRISLTDNCNLRCFYCMPDEHYEFAPAHKLMQPDEILALANTFVRLGVKKIRLTGGEPLVRKDAKEILLNLSRLPVTLTLTTNGTRVHHFLDTLKDAGVHSLNISLDTLQKDKFLFVTRRDQFDQVFENIRLLLTNDFHVKVNVVVMKGFNENEILDFIRWTRDTPVHVRFIEFMPFEGNHWTSNKVFTLQEILDTVKQEYEVERLQDKPHATAKGFTVPGHAGTFSVISTMSDNFCATCNRIRLTADGKMKNCLFAEKETDLLSALRRGEDIETLIHQNILAKAKALGGQIRTDFEHLDAGTLHNRSMITIGG